MQNEVKKNTRKKANAKSSTQEGQKDFWEKENLVKVVGHDLKGALYILDIIDRNPSILSMVADAILAEREAEKVLDEKVRKFNEANK